MFVDQSSSARAMNPSLVFMLSGVNATSLLGGVGIIGRARVVMDLLPIYKQVIAHEDGEDYWRVGGGSGVGEWVAPELWINCTRDLAGRRAWGVRGSCNTKKG